MMRMKSQGDGVTMNEALAAYKNCAKPEMDAMRA